MHVDSLRLILTKEFNRPDKIKELDIVEVMFRYKEEKAPNGQPSGFFLPLPSSRERCMWLKKENDGKYSCKLFWNKTADQLVGFAEQVVGKGMGCTLEATMFQKVVAMVFRDHRRMIYSPSENPT
jgi:hypothetical protein